MAERHSFYKQEVEPENIWLNKEYLIQLNITGNCPCKCDFCYAKSYSNNFLTLAKIKRLWENLRKYCYEKKIEYRVNITGGDIFYHPEWKEIAKFIAEEESITAVDPLLNRFWKESDKELLEILKKKINFVQLNSDIVREEDIQAVKDIGKKVVLKISLYSGEFKKNLNEIKQLTDKFDNIIVSIDLIIPQKGSKISKDDYLLDKPVKLREKVHQLKSIFGSRLWLLSTTVKREVNKEVFYCPIPFGGAYVMPDGKIAPCSRYSHLDTGYTTDNFDLISYVTKFNKLVSNYCLCENKYFTDFWDEKENPLKFTEV